MRAHSSPTDLYHLLLQAPWRGVFYFVTGSYLIINGLFGAMYWIAGGIQGTDGSFTDHFFFSVQTFATIGYGVMHPATKLAHWLVVLESVCGMLLTAMVTGLVFAKFSSVCKCSKCHPKE